MELPNQIHQSKTTINNVNKILYPTTYPYLNSPATKEWKQAHSQARFVLLHVMLNAGEGFLDVKEVKGEDGNPDLLLTMDRSKLVSVGKPAMGEFLKKLQVFKSLGDVASAKVIKIA